jgi:hypothetical protein
MNLTDKQKKFLWLAVAVVAISYLFPSILGSMWMLVYRWRTPPPPMVPRTGVSMSQPNGSLARGPSIAGSPNSQPASGELTDAAAPFRRLQGVWQGAGIASGDNVCSIRFELQENQSSKGRFWGYSTLTCTSLSPTKSLRNIPLGFPGNVNTASAILSGAPENNSLHLIAEKTIGKDSNGCAVTALTVMPFGTNQIAVDWQRAECSGGQAVLQKGR